MCGEPSAFLPKASANPPGLLSYLVAATGELVAVDVDDVTCASCGSTFRSVSLSLSLPSPPSHSLSLCFSLFQSLSVSLSLSLSLSLTLSHAHSLPLLPLLSRQRGHVV